MARWSGGAVQRRTRARLFGFWIGIVACLVMAVAACTQSPWGPDDAEKSAMRELRAIAEVSANILNVYMDARVTEMLVCSATGEQFKIALSNPEARADANRALEGCLKASGAYEAIIVVDKNGVCIAAAPAELVNGDFAADSAFMGAIAGTTTASDVHKSDAVMSLDPKSKGWTAAIAVPLKVGNAPAGVLFSYLKWSRVEELITGVRVGQTGYVFVLDRENRVIVHPARLLYGTGLKDPGMNLQELDAAVRKRVSNTRYDFRNVKTGYVDTKLVGFAYPQGYRNFPGLGWTVGASADEHEMVGSRVPWWRLFF